MGYYSRFECQSTLNSEQIDLLEKISGYESYATIEGHDVIKWYDFEDDVREFSKSYPDELFEWLVVGEESPDMWKGYAKNGKFTRLVALHSFPEFTEDLLQ